MFVPLRTSACSLWLSALLSLGCAPTEPPREPAPSNPAPAEESPQAAPDEVEALVEQVDDSPEGARLGQALEQITRTMAEMRAASARAAEGASSPCEAAYLSLVAANEVVQNADLPTAPPTPVLAPRPRFMQLCATLPEELQRCGRFDYRSEHNAACTEAFASASPENTRAITEMAQLDPEG